MRVIKKSGNDSPMDIEETTDSNFLRQIEVQSTIIKRMLAEIDVPSIPEGDQKQDKGNNDIFPEHEDTDIR